MEMFRSFSVTETGSKHEDGICQDASDSKDYDNITIAIVADGHGSSRCFRSHEGSKQAVRITKSCIESFMAYPKNALLNPAEAKNNNGKEGKAELRELGRQIINKWFNAVMNHEKASPLADDPKIELIPEKYKNRYLDNLDYRCHAYGTTLLAVAVTKDFWFGIQIGDGKCVVLYEDGSWALPIPPDDRCSHNTTTSICDDEPVSALEELRCWFGLKDEIGKYIEYCFGVDGQNKDSTKEVNSKPLAIFIGSDGVEDSYPRVENDKYVTNFYRNRVINIFESGFETTKAEIEEWAKRFAHRESTDDVSIAGIVGDFTDKTAMIETMKRESANHEISELAAVKRRDADEKKEALATVEKRTKAVIANQKQLEGRISTIEQELSTLRTKKYSYETTLEKGNTKIAVNERNMLDNQYNLHKLEKERGSCVREENSSAKKITFADDEIRKAKKTYEKLEKDCKSKQNSLQKKKDTYNKYLQNLPTSKLSAQPVIDQDQKTFVTQIYKAITTNTNIDRQYPDPPSTLSAFHAHTGVVADDKLEKLMYEINKLTTGLESSKTQMIDTRQKIEAKSKELADLHQQLGYAMQRTQQVEADIERALHEYRMIENQNRQQKDAVMQCQSEIADADWGIETKQAEINKLKTELETYREQTKKQTDTLAIIRDAWEKAEEEAAALEASIHQNKLYGDD